MRTIKELLQVMLDKQECFNSGLCTWSEQLLINNLISFKEQQLLYRYIQDNRPHWLSSFNAFKCRNRIFYWEPYNIVPRIKWIRYHIKKYST